MMSWDELFDENIVVESTPTPAESTKKPEKKKVESTPTKVETTKSVPKNPISNTPVQLEKILDISALWGQICDLRGDFGMTELLALLAGKTVQSCAQLSKNKVSITRTKAASAILTLFRKLKSEGFV